MTLSLSVGLLLLVGCYTLAGLLVYGGYCLLTIRKPKKTFIPSNCCYYVASVFDQNGDSTPRLFDDEGHLLFMYDGLYDALLGKQVVVVSAAPGEAAAGVPIEPAAVPQASRFNMDHNAPAWRVVIA